jgi:V/A-type H+-transporting ATPase subunit E
MADELQHLMERIRLEAIESAQAQANQILGQAREKAASLVRDAEAESKAILEKAEQDSRIYVERSQRTLEQAARDLLITVGQGVENILRDIVGNSVNQALDTEFLKQMMLTIAQAYCAKEGQESRIEFLISEQDQKAIVDFFADQYRRQLIRGVQIVTDNNVLKGVRVSLKDEQVQHDFTAEAIAEALTQFLRQHLADIVHRAAHTTDHRPPPK